jgi:NAD(P)-dependent dehydrogenase (short-subunit alcohol dehydrogenase family)
MSTGAELDGMVVVVAGASRGIGAACAIACARAGAGRLIMLARDAGALEAVAREVSAAGAEAEPLLCDVSSPAAIHDAFNAIERVDVLIDSAGINRPEPLGDVTQETFDRMFAVNVRGAFFLAQAAAKAMRRRGEGGVIVTISSQMGHVGAANRTVYCATKHALEGLNKALAVELAPYGIRSVSIAPTFVRTALTAAQLDDPRIGPALLEQIPQGRFGTAEEVGAAVAFAASPAAGLMTGSSLVLDGGWTAR